MTVPSISKRRWRSRPQADNETSSRSPGRRLWWTTARGRAREQGQARDRDVDTKSDDLTTAYYARATELMLETAPVAVRQGRAAVQTASPARTSSVPPSRADMILCMRMAHNLVRSNGLENFLRSPRRAQDRWRARDRAASRARGSDPAKDRAQGYVPEAWLTSRSRRRASSEKKSDINANSKDTKGTTKGVWTLPRTSPRANKGQAKYEAIGESDRMTLKFVKPKTKTPAGRSQDEARGRKGRREEARRDEGRRDEDRREEARGRKASRRRSKRSVRARRRSLGGRRRTSSRALVPRRLARLHPRLDLTLVEQRQAVALANVVLQMPSTARSQYSECTLSSLPVRREAPRRCSSPPSRPARATGCDTRS